MYAGEVDVLDKNVGGYQLGLVYESTCTVDYTCILVFWLEKHSLGKARLLRRGLLFVRVLRSFTRVVRRFPDGLHDTTTAHLDADAGWLVDHEMFVVNWMGAGTGHLAAFRGRCNTGRLSSSSSLYSSRSRLGFFLVFDANVDLTYRSQFEHTRQLFAREYFNDRYPGQAGCCGLARNSKKIPGFSLADSFGQKKSSKPNLHQTKHAFKKQQKDTD